MNDIGNKLKALREENNLTRKEAVERLKQLGIDISDKTLYGYESGRNSANADMFLALCQIYNCSDILGEFANTKNDVLFTNREWELIEKYRLISHNDADGKILIDATINHLHENAKMNQEQADVLAAQAARIAELEATHKQTAMEQAAAIIDYERATSNLYLYAYMGKIACAGTGFYFDDIPIETVEVPYMKDADFIIGVNGNSMEPDYHDGDKLYVKKAEELIYGEVGIFTVNNECFLKEYGNNGLISRNPKYSDIPGTEDVRLIGRVLGRVKED